MLAQNLIIEWLIKWWWYIQWMNCYHLLSCGLSKKVCTLKTIDYFIFIYNNKVSKYLENSYLFYDNFVYFDTQKSDK